MKRDKLTTKVNRAPRLTKEEQRTSLEKRFHDVRYSGKEKCFYVGEERV